MELLDCIHKFFIHLPTEDLFLSPTINDIQTSKANETALLALLLRQCSRLVVRQKCTYGNMAESELL